MELKVEIKITRTLYIRDSNKIGDHTLLDIVQQCEVKIIGWREFEYHRRFYCRILDDPKFCTARVPLYCISSQSELVTMCDPSPAAICININLMQSSNIVRSFVASLCRSTPNTSRLPSITFLISQNQRNNPQQSMHFIYQF